MDKRLRFVARLLDGEKMARLCREFEISRKTGYKIFSRYKDCGVEGLTDRSRRPEGTALSRPYSPNDLWCADYKGEFMLADRRYCYPLTITDFATRYLISCEALANTQAMYALPYLSGLLRTSAYPQRFAPITALPLLAPTRSLA
jgi:hypothetical protein